MVGYKNVWKNNVVGFNFNSFCDLSHFGFWVAVYNVGFETWHGR